MAFPHPKSRKDHDGEEDEACEGRVIRYLIERTVDVADDRNAADDVNPAKKLGFARIFHEYACSICRPAWGRLLGLRLASH